jgi:hypothetical protein
VMVKSIAKDESPKQMLKIKKVNFFMVYVYNSNVFNYLGDCKKLEENEV